MRTLAEFREKQLAAERAFILAALKSSNWVLWRVVEGLGVSASGMRVLLQRHGLMGEYRKHSAGPGRPSVDSERREKRKRS